MLDQGSSFNKNSAREVNGMGGEFAKRVFDQSKFKSKMIFYFVI